MILLVMLCLIFLIQDTDSNNMVDLVKYPIFQEYSDYLTEDEIKTDMVKNIQKRIMGMSDMQRNELGISDDFLQSNNLFDMIDNKQIRFVYDERSSTTQPSYHIKADFDGSGLYYSIDNPYSDTSYAPVIFGEAKPDYLESSPDNLREQAYIDEWADGYEERIKGYEQRGMGETRKELAEFINYNMFKFGNDITMFGKDVAESIADALPFFEYNHDNWKDQSSKIQLRINEQETSNKALGVKNTDSLYNYIFDEEENMIFKPNAYETIAGNGDWTIGMGLSLKNETVINALKDKGYSIEKLISQEETITEKDAVDVFNIKINEAKQIATQKFKNAGVDITGVKDSYLFMAVVSMQYQGLIGDSFIQAAANYIKTGDEKYLGKFGAYTEDGTAIRRDDPRYATRPVTMLGELYNDGLAGIEDDMKGIFYRNERRAKLLMAWTQGQYTNSIKYD
jgi:GH24 family phage-related lysozyme (muramidase)